MGMDKVIKKCGFRFFSFGINCFVFGIVLNLEGFCVGCVFGEINSYFFISFFFRVVVIVIVNYCDVFSFL